MELKIEGLMYDLLLEDSAKYYRAIMFGDYAPSEEWELRRVSFLTPEAISKKSFRDENFGVYLNFYLSSLEKDELKNVIGLYYPSEHDEKCLINSYNFEVDLNRVIKQEFWQRTIAVFPCNNGLEAFTFPRIRLEELPLTERIKAEKIDISII